MTHHLQTPHVGGPRVPARTKTWASATMAMTFALLAHAADIAPTVDDSATQRRWINASTVNLRTRPALDAPVLLRLALNTPVVLLGSTDDFYCAVSTTDAGGASISGYTACRYLGMAARPDVPSPSSPPRDDSTLEDERLARGTFGPAPRPYESWARLKASAVSLQPVPGSGKSRPAPSDEAIAATIGKLAQTLGLYSIEGDDRRPGVLIDLVRAVELPATAPSMFRSSSDIGRPFEDAAELSGRFHVIAIQRIRRRSSTATAHEPVPYQLVDRTQFLARPVHKVRLFRDGTIRSEASTRRSTDTLYAPPDDRSSCPEFDGYQLGRGDPAMFAALYNGAADAVPSNPDTPPDSLLWFYLPSPPLSARASATVTTQSFDRSLTGFVSATTTTFDLDGDGIADLLVWEGTGHGPGHLEGRTRTDDAYQRLFFVNIQGQWSVLTSDQFSYGCGC